MRFGFGWLSRALHPLRRALVRVLRVRDDAEQRLERAMRVGLEGHWELDLVRHTRWHSASFQALLGYEARPLED